MSSKSKKFSTTEDSGQTADAEDNADNKTVVVVPGMKFVPIGRHSDPGHGVYYSDFTPHFKECLRKAAEDADREAREAEEAEKARLRSERYTVKVF